MGCGQRAQLSFWGGPEPPEPFSTPDHAAMPPLAIAFLCISWLFFSLSLFPFLPPLLSFFFFSSIFPFFPFPHLSAPAPFSLSAVPQSDRAWQPGAVPGLVSCWCPATPQPDFADWDKTRSGGRSSSGACGCLGGSLAGSRCNIRAL